MTLEKFRHEPKVAQLADWSQDTNPSKDRLQGLRGQLGRQDNSLVAATLIAVASLDSFS